MSDHWLFKSETYDNCNCAINCGCQFNLPSTYGYCQSAFIGNIVDGHFNDTPLAGLNWAGLYKWPGEIAEGNGKRQIIIDERADEAQRTALKTIISGEACEPLSNFFSVFAFVALYRHRCPFPPLFASGPGGIPRPLPRGKINSFFGLSRQGRSRARKAQPPGCLPRMRDS